MFVALIFFLLFFLDLWPKLQPYLKKGSTNLTSSLSCLTYVINALELFHSKVHRRTQKKFVGGNSAVLKLFQSFKPCLLICLLFLISPYFPTFPFPEYCVKDRSPTRSFQNLFSWSFSSTPLGFMKKHISYLKYLPRIYSIWTCSESLLLLWLLSTSGSMFISIIKEWQLQSL